MIYWHHTTWHRGGFEDLEEERGGYGRTEAESGKVEGVAWALLYWQTKV